LSSTASRKEVKKKPQSLDNHNDCSSQQFIVCILVENKSPFTPYITTDKYLIILGDKLFTSKKVWIMFSLWGRYQCISDLYFYGYNKECLFRCCHSATFDYWTNLGCFRMREVVTILRILAMTVSLWQQSEGFEFCLLSTQTHSNWKTVSYDMSPSGSFHDRRLYYCSIHAFHTSPLYPSERCEETNSRPSGHKETDGFHDFLGFCP